MRLSVVLPVFNEAASLQSTLHALAAAVDEAELAAVEVLLVDDGSTDGSAAVAEHALAGRLPLRVLSQPNRGRFEARRAGLEAATEEWVLLLDGRVRLRGGSLAFVRSRVEAGEQVWNAHVHVDTAGNPYGAFSDILVRLAWREYFDSPRTTSFGAEDFDRYPKGTTCFLAPRSLLVEAFASFESRYADLRLANDDTPALRWIAARERINISPSFACDYSARGSLERFLRHGFHRGTVFVDGHGRPESRFFPGIAAFYPVSLAVAVAALRRPALVPLLGAACAAAATALGTRARRPWTETLSFGALAPAYAVAHGAGMWRGLAIAVRDRVSRAR